MSNTRKRFVPRTIDKTVFAILGLLQLTNAVYLIGPWYLSVVDNHRSPLFALFNSDTAVKCYGVLLLIDAIGLLYSAFSSRTYSEFRSSVLRTSLLAGFILRLYAFMGVTLTLESWRPPGYLSHAATIAILGAYWLWIKVNERLTE